MDIQPDSDSSMPVCFDWLCAECASLFDSTAVLYPSETGLQTRQYHHNIEELKACVRLGCHLCTALLEKLNYSGYTEYLEKNLASVGERMVNTDHRLWAIYPVPCYKHRDPTQRYKKQIYRLDFFLDLDKSLPSWNPKSLSRSESRKASFELVPANCRASGIPSIILSVRRY